MNLFSGFLLSIMLLVTAPACKKSVSEVADQKQDYKDVPYGTDAAQKMDVYLPASRNTTATKTLVFIHGGSWSAGDKADFNDAIIALKDQLPDFAIFNLNYRLAANPVNINPAQINDVQSAINFIKTKSSKYVVNPDKVCLIGASAGAHLALLQAYKNNSDGRIKAVVDLFGPTDLTKLYNEHPVPVFSQPVLLNYLGTTPALSPIVYQDASPINFVTAQSVPTQIFHGDADPVVPIVQSTTLKAKLQSLNVKTEMIVYPGAGHGWYDATLLDTYAKAIAFIKQNVQ